ncbi:MAG TPA: isoprenylcysteine carboxylmethyltransferase family protein [Fodinibius sp.]|nr:isoprenylcysteine carboxylmethyltransferase family protein [Fodinibius sp.]
MIELKLKIPPAVVWFVVVLLMWGIDRLIPLEWLSGGFRICIAAAAAVAGGLLGLLGILSFYRQSTTINPHKPEHTGSLVTEGVYRFSRNPMYLGLLFALVAVAIYLGNPVTAVGWILFVGYMNRFQIRPEEQMMTQKFGKAYQQYQEKVNRWI